MDYKILNRTRPITGAELRPHRIDGRLNTLSLAFAILEHDDGLAGQIIYEGASNAPLRIAGIIEGVPAGVRDGSSFSWVDVIRYSDNGWALLGGAVVALGLIVGIGAMMRALRRWPARAPPPAPVPGQPSPTTRNDLVVGIVFLVVFLVVTCGLMITKYPTVREKARQRSVNSVPRAVLP